MSREEVERFMAQRMQNQDVQYAHGLQQQLFAAQQRIAELEAALEGLLNHTKNNQQICGLNDRARAALHKEEK